MSKFWKGKRQIRCPYYLGEREKCILCKGTLSDKVQFIFKDAESKKAYKSKYCKVEMSSCMHKICLSTMDKHIRSK